jgi:hypothetical protein
MSTPFNHIVQNNGEYARIVGTLTIDGEMNLDVAHNIVEKLTADELYKLADAIMLISLNAKQKAIRESINYQSFEKPTINP